MFEIRTLNQMSTQELATMLCQAIVLPDKCYLSQDAIQAHFEGISKNRLRQMLIENALERMFEQVKKANNNPVYMGFHS